jgi:hypothetical protein
MKPFVCLSVSALAACAGSLVATADSFVLTGSYLSIGVGSDGSLVDDGFAVGLQYDPEGSGTFPRVGAFGSQDLLLTQPGNSTWEYLALRVAGVHYGYGATTFGSWFGLTTTDTSAGSLRSAHSVGTIGPLDYTGDLWFDQNAKAIDFSVTLANPTQSVIDDIYFSRGLDLEPDYWTNGSLSSRNVVDATARSVTAAGFVSWPSLTILDLIGGAEVSVSNAAWGTEDPFLLYTSPPNAGDGENRIHIAYYQPTLNAGESVTWHFQYSVIPEPRATLALTAVLLLGGGCLWRQWRQR